MKNCFLFFITIIIKLASKYGYRSFQGCRLILFFFLFHCNAYSQNNNFEKNFSSLNINERIEFYSSLNDSIKILNKDFLKETFENDVNAITDKSTSRHLQMNIAQLNYHSGNYIQSVNILRSILEEKNNQLVANDSMSIYDELKKSYYQLYLYPEIFEVNSKIKELISNGSEYPLWSYNMNSKLYGRLRQFDKAAIELKKELKNLIKSEPKDFLIIPSAYNDLGYYYSESKNHDSALINYNRSLEFADKSLKSTNISQYEHITSVVKGNIAEIYVINKMYKKAIPLLIEDVTIGIKSKSNIGSTAHSYNLLATCYLELGDFKKANEIINNTKPLIVELTDNPSLVGYLKTKASYFNKIQNSDSSSYYYKEAFKVKNFIDKKGKRKILASNELIYSITEEHRLLEKHKTDFKNQEIKLKNKQKNILIFFTLILLLLLVLSLYNGFKLKKSRKAVREKNKEIMIKSDQIKVALSEKEVLLKEVHHRVKNNLQVISGLLELQNISVTDESVKLALQEGQNRIQSVALVHKMMYQSENVSKVDMQLYLEELLQALHNSFSNLEKDIKTKIQAKGVNLDIILAVPISLIVNEAVCNIYKHAFNNKTGGNIYITISKVNKDDYSLVIKDNGVGLPDNFDISKLKSIGFDLIKGLSKQIKGKLKVKNDKGTEINILFKSSKIS